MTLRRWTHPEHPLRLASAVAEIAFRLRWWWRVRRGKCPLGPPPPCPEPEEFEVNATYICITTEDPHDPTKRTPQG